KAWDLDLAKRRDVATLYERVHAAAASVCRAETDKLYRDTRIRAPSGWRAQCVQDAVDATVRRVGNPALAALHTQAPRVAADVR
ncbi:MAG TPA: UrcA family protein, partial [Gammaproteobacteria bacterium]|nr:UrcA family protein [Gammaproteobacteria bacterium]